MFPGFRIGFTETTSKTGASAGRCVIAAPDSIRNTAICSPLRMHTEDPRASGTVRILLAAGSWPLLEAMETSAEAELEAAPCALAHPTTPPPKLGKVHP